jgi:hypothetical protein
MDGSENCEDILLLMDKNIKMSEISFSGALKSYTYDQLKQFRQHLPNKHVIHTITEQKLLNPIIGYDFLSQLYLRKSMGDTVRETSSRIWQNKNGKWKIVQMNNALRKECY